MTTDDLYHKLIGSLTSYVFFGEKSLPFFKPFESKKDFFFSAGSVITAPIIFETMAPVMLLRSGWSLLLAIKNFLTGSNPLTHLGDSADYLIISCMVMVVGMVAPILNLIDFIGSIVNSLLLKYAKAPVPEASQESMATVM